MCTAIVERRSEDQQGAGPGAPPLARRNATQQTHELIIRELTCSADIKLNERVSLRRHAGALSIPHRTISRGPDPPWQSRQAILFRLARFCSENNAAEHFRCNPKSHIFRLRAKRVTAYASFSNALKARHLPRRSSAGIVARHAAHSDNFASCPSQDGKICSMPDWLPPCYRLYPSALVKRCICEFGALSRL
jgi:hypothetical protein